MEFNVFSIRKAYLKGYAEDNILLKQFMEFERKFINDYYKSDFKDENERCLAHIKNLINGSIKEIIFYCCICEEIDIKKRGRLGYYYTDRGTIGESDFYNSDGENIELKAFDKFHSDDDLLKMLNNKQKEISYFHNADIVYFWFPFYNKIKCSYKLNGVWHIKDYKSSLIYKMREYYEALKV